VWKTCNASADLPEKRTRQMTGRARAESGGRFVRARISSAKHSAAIREGLAACSAAETVVRLASRDAKQDRSTDLPRLAAGRPGCHFSIGVTVAIR
jgi:hypothetical protein